MRTARAQTKSALLQPCLKLSATAATDATAPRCIAGSSSACADGANKVSLSILFANAMAPVSVNPSPSVPVSKARYAQDQRLCSWSLTLASSAFATCSGAEAVGLT